MFLIFRQIFSNRNNSKEGRELDRDGGKDESLVDDSYLNHPPKKFPDENKIVNNEFNLTIIQYILGPIVSIGTFFYFNGGLIIKESSLPSFIAAVGAYIVSRDLLAFIFTRRSMLQSGALLNEINESHDNVIKEIRATSDLFRKDVKKSLRVTKLDLNEVSNRITASAKKAHHVQNTCINLHLDKGFFGGNVFESIRAYRSFLSRSNINGWHDLMGLRDFRSGRLEQLVLEDVRISNSYKATILDVSSPVINFIIFHSKDGSHKELYFGWMNNNSGSYDVFFSTDFKLVSHFINYFGFLHQQKSLFEVDDFPVEDALSKIQRLPAKQTIGTWLSISGNVNRFPNKDGKGDSSRTIKKYVILTINYEKTWEVHGQEFDFETGEQNSSFLSTDAVWREGNLFMRYQTYMADGLPGATAMSNYNFTLKGDHFTGYYVLDSQGNRRRLRGMRISEEPIARSDFRDMDQEHLLSKMKQLLSS